MKVQTTARLRLSATASENIKVYAQARNRSVSAVIRDAMVPYLTGQKILPTHAPTTKETTFTCYTDDFSRFKELAKESGVSWDEAVRIAVEECLNAAKAAKLDVDLKV